MKKEVMAAIAAALAIWFFVMGFELGIYKERRAYAKLAAQTNPPSVSSTAPSASPSDSAVLPTAPGNDVTVAPSTAPQPTVPGNDVTVAPTGKEINNLSTDEILQNTANAVNTLKQTPNFTALRKLQVVVKVVDCSVPSAVEKINEIITGTENKILGESFFKLVIALLFGAQYFAVFAVIGYVNVNAVNGIRKVFHSDQQQLFFAVNVVGNSDNGFVIADNACFRKHRGCIGHLVNIGVGFRIGFLDNVGYFISGVYYGGCKGRHKQKCADDE